LLVDQDPKTQNDRTWCFWERETGLFEPIVHHRWNQLKFDTDLFSASFDLNPYSYKMIRGIDFYQYVMDRIPQYPNIVFRQERVLEISNDHEADSVAVQLGTQTFRASYVLNSIRFDASRHDIGSYQFLQHFKGWLIRTDEPHFAPSVANFMDFRISQEHGTAFMYVLPLTAHTALIEYTLFTESLLPDSSYDRALEAYIRDTLSINQYQIDHVERASSP